ncbi:MAG: hypothetical protein COB23_07500 [Methylophaga sp.]|nr:MAG: hypothetical protein COB23_07500 [Methylophaga sp.]
MKLSQKLSWIVVVSVLLTTILALFIYYQSSKQSLLRSEIADLKHQTQALVDVSIKRLLMENDSEQLADITQLLSAQNEYDSEQHFLLDLDKNFILAGPWQSIPENLQINYTDESLAAVFKQPLSLIAQHLGRVKLLDDFYEVIAIEIAPMQWSYFRMIPTDKILAPLQKQIWLTLLLITLAMILAGVLINIAARRMIVTPLLGLTDKARHYACGDVDTTSILTSGVDEIAQLERALDTMQENLCKETEQLLISEQRYRDVVDTVREVIVQIGKNGTWQFLSPTWRHLSGNNYKTSVHKPVAEFLHPSEHQKISRVIKSLYSGDIQSWLGEVRLLTIDQRYIWINMSLQVNIKQHMIVGTLENIHMARLSKDVNDTLRTAEKMVLVADCSMSTLLTFIAQEMVLIMDVPLFWIMLCKDKHQKQLFAAGERQDFLYDNDGLWLGLHNEGGPVMQVVRDCVPIHINQYSNVDSVWKVRLKRDDLQDSLFFPFNPSNEYQGVIGIHSELVEQFDKEYQQIMTVFASELRLICQIAEDQRLMRLHRMAVEKTANAIMITDEKGIIEWVNDSFIRLTQYNIDEVLGLSPRLLRSGENHAGYVRDIWQTVSDGDVWQGEIVNRRKDGSLFNVLYTITPLTDNDGMTTHFVAILEDVTERHAAQQRINYLATHDGLTGLPNRSLLQDRLAQAIFHAQRHNTKMAVLFIDVDQFKYINDSLGHQQGDELLKTLTQRLQKMIRGEDTLARFGGDEFVVVMPEITDINDACNMANKLLDQMQQPYHLASHELTVTGSIGISIYPDDAIEPDDLIQYADAAMYLAKDQGRNNSQFYTQAINEKIVHRLNLEKGLRKALESDEFVLLYQPKIDLYTGQIIGMEALIRWQSPELGLVPPMDFIPLAEETGIILPIGEWVMTTACEQMKVWLKKFPWLNNVAINISIKQFKQADFVKQAATILDQIGIPANKVEFELTESLVMNDVESAIQTMEGLKALGITLSIDDFGTGYSSLSYLKRFPVDILKIDRSFVSELDSDTSDHAIVRSIIALADNLGLQVVAEGVERKQQQDLLTLLGCQFAQGYFFSKPISVDEMTTLLTENQP